MDTQPEPKILIIEDNPVDALVAKRALHEEGYVNITTIEDGLKGLNFCLVNHVDLLILDLGLPSVEGVEICRMLRSSSLTHKLPIIITSALEDSKQRELELLGIGADKYLEKPLDPKELSTQIEQLLQQKKRRRKYQDDAPTVVQNHSSTEIDLTLVDSQQDVPIHPSDPNTPPLEDDFEGFKILSLLGSGGMGTVYKARQTILNRIVALKVLLVPETNVAETLKRFHREAMLMAQLNHPNIVQIYNASTSNFTFYIVMEYMSEGSLSNALLYQTFKIHDFPDLVEDSVNAINYLHSHEVIHNDIKPGNILRSFDNAYKISDFGISRYTDTHRIAESGQWLRGAGTPGYRSPEVAAGNRCTELSDQYSLARTLQRVFDIHEPCQSKKPLSETRPDLPKNFIAVFEKAMNYYPKDRYPTLDDFRSELFSNMPNNLEDYQDTKEIAKQQKD